MFPARLACSTGRTSGSIHRLYGKEAEESQEVAVSLPALTNTVFRCFSRFLVRVSLGKRP
jgi:hypothetical protein